MKDLYRTQGGRSCTGARGPPPKSLDSDENFKPEYALICSKEPGQTHRGDRGTKSCLSHWPPGCLLANLIMLEANCDHSSLLVLTITSHKALGAESLLFFFDEAGSWFRFRLDLGRMKSFWVERPRTGALRHWPL